ncbi:hypothetical protein E6W39_25930 [Kitasatospora acidiphila]|uniref:ABM domain-containing protein n=1 Tax=Kitasatospora acidiphila TaxID=2567942 RepID=A0A540W7P5_9ACTN|nr:hypothetical protein [Kitasatospora acidiphila]TQF05046.1 hypothetical protein E6W39_25930 [Kitasatospora acidiphila]
MWEARAADGRGAELLAWARERVVPALAGAGAARTELFSAPGERVLVISWWPERAEPAEAPQPPDGLLARPVHRWAFHSEYVVSAASDD